MISYEVNLLCDDPLCGELICTEPIEAPALGVLLCFAEEKHWQVTWEGIFCPDHHKHND